MKKSAVRDKSFEFALKVVEVYKGLRERKEFVMSRQLLRSGTAIGAMVREAEQAESRADFIHKLAIGLKESHESAYWIELLTASGYMTNESGATLQDDLSEILRLLTSIIKSSKADRIREASGL